MALFFAFYALAPSLLGMSLAYIIRHRDLGQAVPFGALMVVLTWFTHTYGHRWLLGKVRPDAHGLLRLLRLAGLAMAPIIFVMVVRLL